MNNLAALYDRGDGVAQDRNEARKWFELAAKGGVTVAMTNLGIIYLRDSGAASDPAEARVERRRPDPIRAARSRLPSDTDRTRAGIAGDARRAIRRRGPARRR